MRKTILTIALLSSMSIINAQTESIEPAATAHTIKSTFEEILRESNNYQDFKVIKRRKLDDFIKEVGDSLKLSDERLAIEIKAKGEYQSQILQLQTDLEQSRSQVAKAEESRDTITSAGMQMEKQSFSTLMWGLVIGLALALAFVLFRSRTATTGQKDLQNRLNDVEEQLSQTKKKSLEREQELKREVQDYVNRLDALKPPR